MNLLILGGTAWLGRQIAAAALGHGHHVTCLARGESGEVAAGATLVRADRSQVGGYGEVAGADWDAVVDVTWQPGFIRGAVDALAPRVGHWVYLSSCSVYAEHDTPGADESAALLPALESDHAGQETYGEAKVACEEILRDAVGEQHCTVARAGLIGGPGDHSNRTTYWPARFAEPAGGDGAVLVPDSPGLSTQVIDARDLAAWLVHGAQEQVAGAFNLCGEAVPLPDHLAAARSVAGHTGPQVPVAQDWLAEHEVDYWAGPRSLPIWLPLPDYAGFCSRDSRAALAAGLRLRPLAETMADGLAWSQSQPADWHGIAGLTHDQERELLAAARYTAS